MCSNHHIARLYGPQDPHTNYHGDVVRRHYHNNYHW